MKGRKTRRIKNTSVRMNGTGFEAPRRSRFYSYGKRALDLLIVGIALPLVAPVFIVCATLIKMDSPRGPIFFTQKRTGKDGKRFVMYKFRTMVVNAEALKQDLLERNTLTWPDFKLDEDPRITRVGGLLRKTSLDELPQLINVIKGDMTLVGPRPTSFEASTYRLWHAERLEVVPGITGLWQIKGRGTIDFDDRVRLDIEYIEKRSLFYDISLLLRTVPALVRGS